jgi:hypothetical protein
MTMSELAISYSGTAADLVLHAPDGSELVIDQAAVGDPTEANVPRAFLLTDDFANAVKAGTITFDALPDPPEADKQALAVEVTRFLLNGVGVEMITAGNLMLEGERALEKLRDAYNAGYQQVTAIILAGNALAAGAQNLVDGATALLDPGVQEAAAGDAADALTALDAGFVSNANTNDITNNDDLQPYLTARNGLEATLAAAQQGLAATQEELEAEFGALRQALSGAAAVMDALEPADIGALLSWTWTPPP